MKPSRKFLSSVIFICMGALPAQAAGILNIGGGPASNISGGPVFTPLDPAMDAVVAETSVVSALGANPLVVVSNSGHPAGTSISVLGAVSWANSSTLTLNAATSLTVSANVSNVVGGGSLNLFANNGGVQLNGLVDISNALTVQATAGITQSNLHILRAGGLATFNAASSDITLNGPNNNFGSLHLTGGAVSITEASSSSLAGVNAGSLSLVSAGTITQTGAAKVNGSASFNAGANAITLTNSDNQFGTLSLSGTTIVINEQDSTDLGTVNASSLSVISGGAITNSGNVAVTGAAILNGTSINLGGGSGTASVGSLNFNTTGAASFSLLSGTSITGANTAGNFIWNTNGNASLAGGAGITSTTADIQQGSVTLSGNNQLAVSGNLSLQSGATLNLGTFNNTVGTYSQTGSANLNGTGTLTASTYDLSGGNVNANLGAGILNQVGNTTTFLNGTSAASAVNVNIGTLALGSSNRLHDSAAVAINGGRLNLESFSDTVGSFAINTGILDGTGTLTAATYTLNGGTVNANLGAGILSQTGGTTLLNGVSSSATVNVNGGTLELGASERLSNSAALSINNGTLNLAAFNETVATFALNGGSLNGTGILTAATYGLNGGTVNANLGAGILTQIANNTLLNGTALSTDLNISGGTLSLGASERLNNAAALKINGGTFNLGSFNETVGTFSINTGTLDGTGTLTAATYALSGGAINGNLGAGVLNQIVNTTLLNGTSSAATLNITGGTLELGADNRLADAAALTISGVGILDLKGFNDTVGTFVLNGGTLNGTGTLTAANYGLNGGTVNGNLGAGILTQLSNITLLNGTSSAANVGINGGTLVLGASNRMADAATVTVLGTGTLDLASFDDTVGTFTLNGGLLNGTGTLTAATYSLNGGTVNANLGTGILNQLTNTTTLNGTSAAGGVNINGGALNLGASNRLFDGAAVTINNAILNLGASSDTVGTFTLNSGFLNGSGTLTATAYNLNGGTVNANLGAGSLSQLSGTTLLNGTSAASVVNVDGGNLTLGSSDRLLNTAAVTIASAGTLNLGAFSDTVGTFTLNGGILNGSGTLTAATYDLNGGTVNANLGAGILTQLSNTTTLNGTSAAATVNINGGTLTLGASERLLNTADVTIASAGTLNLGAFSDTVGTFTLNGGILNGSGTLTAATYELNGGTVNANLGAGILTQLSNTTTLNGTSSAGIVNINGGTLALGASDRLLNTAAVTINSGILNLGAFNDTVGAFTLNTGALDGSGTLTAASYDLKGGTVNANLGAGILTQVSDTTTLNGTSAAATVNINGGTLTLGASDRLLDTAAVSIASAGTLNLGTFSDTVGTFTLNGGILNGSGTLTAATYDLNGGTVNANLGAGILTQLSNTTTLNGTSAAATVNINGGTLTLGASDRLLDTAAVSIASAGTLNLGTFSDTVGTFALNGGILNGSGTLTAATYDLNGGTVNANLGTGILTQLSSLTTLNGTSAAATVNINGGTLTLGASDRLLNTADVTIASAGTFNLGTFSDTVGTFTLNGGILNGSGTLTAATYDLNGGTVNANLGTGILTQLSSLTTLNGTSAAATVNINGGTLTLGADNRLLDAAAVTIANAGTLDLGAFSDTVGTFTLNGGTLNGSGTLTAATYDLNGGTVNANLGAGILRQLSNITTLHGTSAAATVDINGGTLTLGASDRLLNSTSVSINSGTLNLDTFNDTVGTFTLNGGTLNGSGTLTAATYDLNGGTVNANLGAGILTQLSNTTTLNGTSAAATVNINGGTLTLGADNRLLDAAAVTIANAGTLDLGAFSDTVGTFTLNGGTLNGSGTLTAATYDLNGGTVNANLGTGILNQLTNTTTLNGASSAATVNINSGTLALGASDRLLNTAAVTVASAGTLNLGAFNDTVGTFTLNGGILNGSGTLTAATYDLNGGTVNANLGTGILTQLSNITTLNGTSSAGIVNINGGTLALGASDRLSDSADVTVTNGTLDIGSFNDVVGSFNLISGFLTGSGSLTAGTYNLSGSIIDGDLGTGTINQLANNTILNGTSAASAVNINGGTLTLGASERLADAATLTINVGSLNLQSFDETVGTFSLNGGNLDGTGTLTATNYNLAGGIVNARLGTGTLTQLSGNTILNGTSAASLVNIDGGTLNFGASDRFAITADVVVNNGILNLGNFSNTVGSFTINGGSLNGEGLLTAPTYDLNGGTINANLGAGVLNQLSNTNNLNGTAAALDINITGGTLALGASGNLANNATITIDAPGALNMRTFSDVVENLVLTGGTINGTGTLTATQYNLGGGIVNAKLGTGNLTQLSGTTVLNGTAAASKVTINGGTLALGASARLSVAAAVQLNSGTLALGAFSDTVGDFTVNGGTLSGTGTLSAASYTLKGGQVNANLGTGILTQTGGVTTLSGTAATSKVNINGGSLKLGASNRLADSAQVIVDGGAFDLGGFNDTVASFSINGGTLDGQGSLTADTYNLLGGTVNANLGTGGLTQAAGTTTLRGRSESARVNVIGGTLALGASERLSDASTLRVTGATLELAAFNETVTTFSLFDGTLSGTGKLTANTYFLRGGLLAGNLGNGKIEQTERTTRVLGTIGSRAIRISGGVLELGASDRIANSAFVRVVDTGVLNLGAFDDRVRIYVQNNDAKLRGTGELFVTDKAKIKGGTVAGNISGNVIVEGKTTISGSIGGGKLDVNTGSLTLLGTAESNTRINNKASLLGTGTVDGNMKNFGNLAVNAGGRNRDLTISGKLENSGVVTLSLKNRNTFESINAGSVRFGGRLVVVNAGEGLKEGQGVQLFKAGSYANAFKSVVAVGFKGKIAFNQATGTLVRLGDGVSLDGKILARNAKTVPASAPSKATLARTNGENGADKRKTATVRALSAVIPVSETDADAPESTEDVPLMATSSKAAPVANNLSPEVHRGLADYTEQALRSHVREAMGQGAIARVGETEAFATTSYHSSGVDGGATNAGYDIDLVGVTVGARHQFNQQAQFGVLFGYDDGDIQGNLVNTESSGVALGAFGSYVMHQSSDTRLIASATYGRYEHDATRRSAGGNVFADGIHSDAFEFTLGVSTVVYEKDGFRITPSAMLRHMTGGVNGFTESGPGTSLAVSSQDIDSSLLELGIDLDYAVRPDFKLVGHLGYIFDLDGSSESVSARNTAAGSLPFSVSAPGIDNEAFVIGAGAYYDVTDNLRVGLTYRSDFRSSDSESSHSVGIGALLSF